MGKHSAVPALRFTGLEGEVTHLGVAYRQAFAPLILEAAAQIRTSYMHGRVTSGMHGAGVQYDIPWRVQGDPAAQTRTLFITITPAGSGAFEADVFTRVGRSYVHAPEILVGSDTLYRAGRDIAALINALAERVQEAR